MRHPFLNIRPAFWLLLFGLLALATVRPGWAALIAVALTFLLARKC